MSKKEKFEKDILGFIDLQQKIKSECKTSAEVDSINDFIDGLNIAKHFILSDDKTDYFKQELELKKNDVTFLENFKHLINTEINVIEEENKIDLFVINFFGKLNELSKKESLKFYFYSENNALKFYENLFDKYFDFNEQLSLTILIEKFTKEAALSLLEKNEIKLFLEKNKVGD